MFLLFILQHCVRIAKERKTEGRGRKFNGVEIIKYIASAQTRTFLFAGYKGTFVIGSVL